MLRWEHADLGTVLPDRSVPLLERSGAIEEVGSWLLTTACRTLPDWHERYDPRLTMSVNVSGRQLQTGDLIPRVTAALDETGVPPETLVLELTGSGAGRAPARERPTSSNCTTSGCGSRSTTSGRATRRWATSAGSRSTASRSTARSSRRSTSPAVTAIVGGLVELARTLRIETVAEGIEVEAQRDHLLEEHCRFGQGFLYARPLPAAEAESVLAATRVSPAAV